MSTLENLFVQVFERKRWIVDQVKQQSDLFDQSLASNSLIDGFQPPSWLISSRFEVGSADLKELKKEDLISSFLFPPPRTNNYPSSTAAHNRFRYKPLLSEGNVQDVLGKNDLAAKGSSLLAPEDVTAAPHQTEARFSDVKSQLDKSQSRLREKDFSWLCLENDVFGSMVVPEGHLDEGITTSPHRTEARLLHAKSLLDKSQSRLRENVVSWSCLESDEFLDARDSSGLVPMSHTNEGISSPPQTQIECCEAGSQLDKSQSRLWKKVVSGLHSENDEFLNARDSLGLVPMSHTNEAISSPPGCCETGSQLDKSKSRSQKKVVTGLCLDNDECLDARDSSRLVPMSHTNEAISSPPQTEIECCETGSQLDKSKSRLRKTVVSGLCLENDERLDARDSSGEVPTSHANEAMSSPPHIKTGCCEAGSQLERSLARMQRSRSRQMALELRNSKSAEVKLGKWPLQTYDSSFTGRITMSEASGGLSGDNRDLLEQHNISDNMNEASCRVTPHGSDTPCVNFVSKPLQPPNFVNGEDMLRNILGYKYVTGADEHETPVTPDACFDAHCSLHKEHVLSLGGKENEHGGGAGTCNRSVLMQTSTPESAQLQNIPGNKYVSGPGDQEQSVTPDVSCDAHCSLHKEHVLSLGGQENEYAGGADACNRGILMQTTTPESVQLQNIPGYKCSTEPDEHKKSVTPDASLDAHCSLHKKHLLSLGGQENDYVDGADAGNRSILMQTTTTEPAQFSCRRSGTPYLTTNSSKHAKKDGFLIADEYICESKFIKSKLNALENSWPQYKRRKIEDTVPFSDGNIKQLKGRHTLTREPGCMLPPWPQYKRRKIEDTVPFSDENFKQHEGSYTLTREPGCLPPSLPQFDWNDGKPPCTPPVKMLGQKISSLPAHHSFEKHKMVNPELTCFCIDEDTCTSEENGTLEEADDIIHECDDSRYGNSSSHRRPLVDMTNTETQKSVSVPKDAHERDSIASVNREPYMLRTQTDPKLKLTSTNGNDRGSKNGKENHSSTIGVNGVEKVSKTHISMEPRLLRKTSEENRLPSFLGKGSKPANIVSNVSSFIPLVQQKQQTTAFATGKRDVKVKALEAAEVAKRLEEKRDRDRKMKKEAAKIKRARVEEEKVKQLELKKRKEADMATKKRLREEQDRKEKERKRRCVEGPWKEQKEQSKLRAEKEEREQRRRAADFRLDKKKHLRNEETNNQKTEKGSQTSDVREEIKAGVRSALDASDITKNDNEVHDDPEGLKEYDNKVGSNACDADTNKFLFTLPEGSGEHSYDISPYQASDNEDEEEHVIPKKKFIPSWARFCSSYYSVDVAKRIYACSFSLVTVKMNGHRWILKMKYSLLPTIDCLEDLGKLESKIFRNLQRWKIGHAKHAKGVGLNSRTCERRQSEEAGKAKKAKKRWWRWCKFKTVNTSKDMKSAKDGESQGGRCAKVGRGQGADANRTTQTSQVGHKSKRGRPKKNKVPYIPSATRP